MLARLGSARAQQQASGTAGAAGLIMTPLSPVAGARSVAILHTAVVSSEPSS
jgi:hypothetical protein